MPVRVQLPMLVVVPSDGLYGLSETGALRPRNNQWMYKVDPTDATRLILREDAPEPPEDYREALERCSTRHWVDRFRGHYRILANSGSFSSWFGVF